MKKRKIINIGVPSIDKKPLLKFRVNVQQRFSKGCTIENMKSFTIHVYKKNIKLETIKNKLIKGFTNEIEHKKNTK